MPDDYFTWELETKKKAFEAGNLGAAYDALILCSEYAGPLPEWLCLALIDAYWAFLKETPKGKKWLRQHRRNMIDFERYDAVLYNRSIIDRIEGYKRAHHRILNKPIASKERFEAEKRLKEIEMQEPWKGRFKWDDAYEIASKLLKPPAIGSAQSIEKSYKRVKRNLAKHPPDYRYLLLTNIMLRPASPSKQK